MRKNALNGTTSGDRWATRATGMDVDASLPSSLDARERERRRRTTRARHQRGERGVTMSVRRRRDRAKRVGGDVMGKNMEANE